MAAEWYFKELGQVYGPFSSLAIRQMANRGRISPDDFVRKGANGKWILAGAVRGLFVEGTLTHHGSAPEELGRQYLPQAKMANNVITASEPSDQAPIASAKPLLIETSDITTKPTSAQSRLKSLVINRKTVSLAAGSVIIVVATGIVLFLKSGYSDPGAVFEAYQKAKIKRDYDTFLSCLTPDSRNMIVGRIVVRAIQDARKNDQIASVLSTHGLDVRSHLEETQEYSIDSFLSSKLTERQRMTYYDETVPVRFGLMIRDKSRFMRDIAKAYDQVFKEPPQQLNGNEQLVGILHITASDGGRAEGEVSWKFKDDEAYREPLRFKRSYRAWYIDYCSERPANKEEKIVYQGRNLVSWATQVKDLDPAVRVSAIRGIVEIGKETADPKAVDLLRELLSDDQPTVVVAAIAGIRDIASSKQLPVQVFRECYSHLLDMMGRYHETVVEKPLSDALHDFTRSHPITATSFLPEIRNGIKSASGSRGYSYVYLLGELKEEAVAEIPFLLSWITKERSAVYKGGAIIILVKIKPDDPKVMNYVRTHAREKNEDAFVRSDCVRALSYMCSIHGLDVIDDLVDLLTDGDQAVQLSALQAFQSTWDFHRLGSAANTKLRRAIPVLEAMRDASDNRSYLRKDAERALEHIKRLK